MALHKGYKFDKGVYHFSLMCKALSHPARVMILKNISTQGLDTYKNITRNIPLHPSTITQHIKILREMNIIDSLQKNGKFYYKLNYTLESTILGLIGLSMGADINSDPKLDKEISTIERRYSHHLNARIRKPPLDYDN